MSLVNSYLDQRMKLRWATPALAIVLFLATAAAARAQDAGRIQMFLISGSSDTPAFDSYSGVGISSTFNMPGVFSVRWVFDIESTSLMREGWVCTKTGRECAVETGVLDETRRENIGLTIQAVLPLGDWVTLSASTGPLYSNLQWTSTSESQRSRIGDDPVYTCWDLPGSGDGGDPVGVAPQRCSLEPERVPVIEHQKRPRIGVVLGGEAQIRPLTSLPFVISAGWDRKVVKMEGCVGSDVTRSYAPFCGWAHSTEWRLGLGFLF